MPLGDRLFPRGSFNILPPPRKFHEGTTHYTRTTDGKMMLELCPFGHLISGTRIEDFAGSWAEVNASNPRTVRCYGTMPATVRL